jgi:hypothetical protein
VIPGARLTRRFEVEDLVKHIFPAANLGREFDCLFMAENPNRFSDLFDLERLFQDRDRSLGQNPIKHGTVRISGDDDDRTVGLLFLGHLVNVIRRPIRQFQIEKDEIKLLLLNCGERFFDRADDDAAKTDFPQKNFKQILQVLIVINHEHGRLAGFLLFKNVLVERGLFDAPAPADLDSRQLSPLHEIVNGRQGNAKVFGGFLDGQEVMHGGKTPIWGEMGKKFRTPIAL